MDTTADAKKSTQRVIPIESPSFVSEEYLEQVGQPALLFDRIRPLAMEIGCGTGDFVIEMAQRRADLNFLAVDIYNKGCLKTCRKVDRNRLGNVRVLRIEARQLLARFFEPETLHALYINCPDPWPKKRHHQRRLVNSDFLALIHRCLAPRGELVFCTDFAHYAHQVSALFPFPGFDNCLEEICAHHLQDYPFSKYMRKFHESGLPLYFVHQRKAKPVRAQESARRKEPVNGGFAQTCSGGSR